MVEGTTIESAVYNGFTHDVEIDLNTVRPISSGGTGANNAADAMSNLGGEGSKIEVLNYDSHSFTAGSFYSKASATNPPVAGHAFAGICYVAVVSGVATSDMFIEVRDRDEATQPGSLYVRQKKNGTWSGWLKAVGTSMSGTPPAAPTDGMFWWDPTRGKLFVWYSDPNTAQWVEAVAMPDMNPDDFVRIDASQNLTPTQQTQARKNIYAAPFDALAYNGMQINGSMEVSQENGTTLLTLVTGTPKYIADGFTVFYLHSANTAVFKSQQIANASGAGFVNSLGLTATTAFSVGAATDHIVIYTPIEGYRTARLFFGIAAAQPVTIGFWVFATVPGTMTVALRNAGTNRCYPVNVVVNSAATWEYKTVTIPGDTTGTWNVTNGVGFYLGFCFGAGTSHQGTNATWQAGQLQATASTTNFFTSTNNAVFITGVVVLPGIEAPTAARSALIMRPYDQELLTCKRYYERMAGNFGSGHCINTTGFYIHINYTEKRAVPTLTATQPTSMSVYNSAGTGVAVVTLNGFTNGWMSSALAFGNTASGLVAGQGTEMYSMTGGAINIDARL